MQLLISCVFKLYFEIKVNKVFLKVDSELINNGNLNFIYFFILNI